MHLPVPLTVGRRGAVGDCIPGVLQPTISSALSSCFAQVGKSLQFLDQWRSTSSNRFVLNMVKGLHLQLWYHPPLFCNFKQFNIKAAKAHHPIIQKEVDELLAKGATEPCTGGAAFTQMGLCFPSALVVYDPYSVSCDSNAICTYLLLRCLL